MNRLITLGAAACVAVAAGAIGVRASGHERTLVVTMTNDVEHNQIQVYDADSHALLQTLPTHGRGGAGGNARGIRQLDGIARRRRQQRIEYGCALPARR